MNQLVFSIFRGALHGGMVGPAGVQAPAYGAATPPPPSGKVIQLQTLQAIGGAAHP